MTIIHPDQREAVIGQLYLATEDDDYAADALERMLIDADLRWRCEPDDDHCGWVNIPEDDVCDGCGRARAPELDDVPDFSLSEHHQMWFYLLAHPEDAKKAARRMLGMAEFAIDSTGHLGEEIK